MNKCTSCKKDFAQLNRLGVCAQCGLVNQFQCEFCDEKFKSSAMMKVHVARAHKCDESSTSQVEQSSNANENLKSKLKRQKKGLTCELCYKIYKTKNRLMQHQQNYHMIVDGNFKCCQCNSSYGTRELLVDHAKQKHDGGRYHCFREGCSARHKTKIDARQHHLSHTTR